LGFEGAEAKEPRGALAKHANAWMEQKGPGSFQPGGGDMNLSPYIGENPKQTS